MFQGIEVRYPRNVVRQGYHTALVPAQAFADDLSATNTAPGTLNTIYNSTYIALHYYRQFSGTVTNSVGIPFMPPRSGRTGVLRYRIYGFSASNDAGNIKFQLSAQSCPVGGSLAAASGQANTTQSIVFAGGNTNILIVSSWSPTFNVTSDTDAMAWGLTLQRLGADAADTSTVGFNTMFLELQYSMLAPNDA